MSRKFITFQILLVLVLIVQGEEEVVEPGPLIFAARPLFIGMINSIKMLHQQKWVTFVNVRLGKTSLAALKL